MIEKDIFVVGGDIASLTAALSLAHSGTKAHLVDKNENCGGLMSEYLCMKRFSFY